MEIIFGIIALGMLLGSATGVVLTTINRKKACGDTGKAVTTFAPVSRISDQARAWRAEDIDSWEKDFAELQTEALGMSRDQRLKAFFAISRAIDARKTFADESKTRERKLCSDPYPKEEEVEQWSDVITSPEPSPWDRPKTASEIQKFQDKRRRSSASAHFEYSGITAGMITSGYISPERLTADHLSLREADWYTDAMNIRSSRNGFVDSTAHSMREASRRMLERKRYAEVEARKSDCGCVKCARSTMERILYAQGEVFKRATATLKTPKQLLTEYIRAVEDGATYSRWDSSVGVDQPSGFEVQAIFRIEA